MIILRALKTLSRLNLARQKRTMKENFLFFKIVTLSYKQLIPMSFLLIEAPLEFNEYGSEGDREAE